MELAAVRARVSDLTFQGPVVRLALTAADGSPVVAHVGPEQHLPMLRPGDDVYVGWDPDASPWCCRAPMVPGRWTSGV